MIEGGAIISDEKKYGTVWRQPPDLIPLGGQWAYAIGIVQDKRTGNLRVRVAKGKVKGYTRRNEKGELEVHPKDPNDPVTQPTRLNVKDLREWEIVDRLVKKWLPQLGEKAREPEETGDGRVGMLEQNKHESSTTA